MPACLSIEVVEDFLDRRLDAESSRRGGAAPHGLRHLLGSSCGARVRPRARPRAPGSPRVRARAHGRGDAPRPSIPGYEIGDEIHRGGQGVVYAATQTSTGRRAAVKVLLSGPRATRAERDRFEREVSIAASLRHPGIVTVFDGGATAEGWNWLAMELVDGLPLHRFLADRSLADRAKRSRSSARSAKRSSTRT